MTDTGDLPTPSLVVFDFDGTLADQRGSWGLLYRLFGVEDAGDRRTESYWDDELTFREWCSGNVDDLRTRGVRRNHVERAAAAIKLTDGAEELLSTLSEHDVPFGVLSAGVSDLMTCLDRFEPAFTVSNEIIYEHDVPCDVRARVGPNDKDARLREICTNRNVPLTDVLYVGDSHSDTEAFAVAGTSILFDPDERFPEAGYELVDAIVEERTLTRVLDHVRLPDRDGHSHVGD